MGKIMLIVIFTPEPREFLKKKKNLMIEIRNSKKWRPFKMAFFAFFFTLRKITKNPSIKSALGDLTRGIYFNDSTILHSFQLQSGYTSLQKTQANYYSILKGFEKYTFDDEKHCHFRIVNLENWCKMIELIIKKDKL
ncbi:hypothetical protein BpHYR1_020385 [Brachionus plicatilis]|uniref:Uncharacterized protein n=1 Tax=Brachionus plicatilis TaxID=10195 RepID=A0A3M7PM27_BRAPC|nr:hypothetical protein BpHYR1_020385 [Brachionus plicatilis]